MPKNSDERLKMLKDDLKSGNIRSLYLFYGPEEFLKRYYLESIENAILPPSARTLNRHVFEGKIDANRLIDCCETLPVLSERKLVLIKNSDLFSASSKADGGKGKELLSYLANVPDYNCLIFYEADVDMRQALARFIEGKGLVVDFPYRKGDELKRWVIKAFRTYGKEVDRIAASWIVENCESGMTEMANEINKASVFAGEKKRVTLEDIEAVCVKSVRVRIFDLIDAISDKSPRRALMILDEMVNAREPIPVIMHMIVRQLRLLLQYKLLLGSGADRNQAVLKLGLKPYGAMKLAKQAEMFSADKLRECLEKSLELDMAVKTGRMDERTAAELLLAQLAKAAKGQPKA